MRIPALRQMLLVVLAGLAGPGCAKEDMLMHKVDVHEVFADNRVAELADAIANDDAERVRALAKQVDLSAHGDDDVTLLEWAVFNQSKQAFKALLDAGANPTLSGMDGSTVAHMAAMVNDPFYLEVLLESGVNPSLRDRASKKPLLNAAVLGRRAEQVHALLAAGADPNGADDTGDTALHVAGGVNDASTALALLQAGADPRAVNAQGVTFQQYLFMAPENLLNERGKRGREEVRAWLRHHGVAVEVPDRPAR